VTREEQKRRRAFVRDVDADAKRVARACGWKYAGGCVFRERRGWFIELRYAVHLHEAMTSVRLHSKPMGLDPVFWDLVDLPENAALPLSFRANGAWTCRTPEIEELAFDDAGLDAGAIAGRVLRWGDERVSALADEWTLDAFIDRMSSRLANTRPWLAALTSGLILAGRTQDARLECLAAQAGGIGGGFSVGDRDFPEMALSWIERSIVLH
jgi:hypothetical protein